VVRLQGRRGCQWSGLSGREMVVNELQDFTEGLARPDPACFARKLVGRLNLAVVRTVDNASGKCGGYDMPR
jgi:hypothetical protein